MGGLLDRQAAEFLADDNEDGELDPEGTGALWVELTSLSDLCVMLAGITSVYTGQRKARLVVGVQRLHADLKRLFEGV